MDDHPNIQRTTTVHKSDAEIQFDWLRQVATDTDLPSTASRIAIALTAYFNREHDGWAWMSQITLATKLGVAERTIRDAMSALVARGHLVLDRRGKMETNRYRLALKCESDRQRIADHDRQEPSGHDRKKSADQEGVTGRSTSSDRQKSAGVTGRNLPPNPLKEPLEEPIEERDSIAPDFCDEDLGRRSRSLSTEIDVHFEAFWVQYPLKKAKAAALRAYRSVITKKLATNEQLMAGVLRYTAERSGQDPRYTKHPATWLNGGCWADEPAQPAGNGPVRHPGPGGGNDHIANAARMAKQAQARRLANGC